MELPVNNNNYFQQNKPQYMFQSHGDLPVLQDFTNYTNEYAKATQQTEIPPAVGNTSSPRAMRKRRRPYTKYQLFNLEREFDTNKYLSIPRKIQMAKNLGLTERQIKVWFQNRRMKFRKQQKARNASPSSTSQGSPNGDPQAPTTDLQSRYNDSVPYSSYVSSQFVRMPQMDQQRQCTNPTRSYGSSWDVDVYPEYRSTPTSAPSMNFTNPPMYPGRGDSPNFNSNCFCTSNMPLQEEDSSNCVGWIKVPATSPSGSDESNIIEP